MSTYLLARAGAFGPEFLVSCEGQPVQGLHLSPLLDSHLVSALQVLGQPDHEEAVQAIFRMLTRQPMPQGFESDLRDLMSQTQVTPVTQSMPGASNATIDFGALLGFVERNPGQALSRPEILVLLITWLDWEAKGNEHWVAFREKVAQQPIISMGDLAVLTAADVDEVLAQSSMSPLWNEIEEMSAAVPELHVDEDFEDILGADVFETMLALPGTALPNGGVAEVLRSLDVQLEGSLQEEYPFLAAQLSNVPGS
ncbi:hypothetical protein [Pseudomonas alkylphenolica]|uniref:hypothetical protein n=1 Tax=Pseudomonas alkylphenolica TaxID=237609 RepID=UPI0018D8E952|nr:hypothetical protein [Pseudomonas alkylphenolica]MBH3429470.1 hypothetical protein [Pseudomonas alkylphenolica]